ncbi:hypothetical protein [Nevskia soli]|uniref:hypothetical protein n=1 Tax=Nevskia soli TaxID=418856 RepID=UPI0004A6A9F7|nr:hypothetical protein [Nevskia soli]
MRLEFRILWFENQPQDVRTQVEEIKEYLVEVGFIPRIDMEIDGGNISELSIRQQKYDDFDLVVVDFDLGDPARNGDQVAKEVRRGFGFTDIIFYSGKPRVDLRKLVHDNNIDGVYCLARTELAEKLGVHIDQAVKRLSRLEAMRGLIMGTVGKADDEFRALLSAAFASAEASSQAKMTKELDDLVANAAGLAQEKYAACKSFNERLVSRAVTSFHLQKLALFILKGDAVFANCRKILARYDNEVLSPRNTLGHATETRGERGWEVSSHGKPAISSADFVKLRQGMAIHLDNICALRPLLDGKRAEQSS